MLGGALLGAGTSIYTANKSAKSQKAAQTSAEQGAATQAQRAEQDYNRANQKMPNVSAMFAGNQRGNSRGIGSTFLTGSSGVARMPLGGGPSLLGA